MRKGSNALDEAFEKQNKTAKAQMQIFSNNFEVLKIKMGAALMPIVNVLMKGLIGIFGVITKLSDKFPLLSKIIVITAAVLIGLRVATIAYTFAAMQMKLAVTTAALLFGKLKIATLAWKAVTVSVTAAQWLLNAALTANPIGVVIMAIAALVAGSILLYKNWGKVTQAFKDNKWLRVLLFPIYALVKGIEFLVSKLGLLKGAWNKVSGFFSGVGKIIGLGGGETGGVAAAGKIEKREGIRSTMEGNITVSASPGSQVDSAEFNSSNMGLNAHVAG